MSFLARLAYRSSRDRFTGANKRNGAQAESGWQWSWHGGSLSKGGRTFTRFWVTRLWGGSGQLSSTFLRSLATSGPAANATTSRASTPKENGP